MQALDVHKLTKVYKDGTMALDELSFTVMEGEVFTLLGRNGAGKSTLINILTEYQEAASGTIRAFGEIVRGRGKQYRKKIACVAQETSIDEHMTLEENMFFQGRLYGMCTNEISSQIEKLIKTFQLDPFIYKKAGVCSGGIKRRLDIAMCLISHPRILFLDEPTVGMDTASRKRMWSMIKKIREEFGTTIFLTTHYLEEADLLSDTICIIRDGHEIIQGTAEELKKYTRQQLVRIECLNEEAAEYLRESLIAKVYVRSCSRKGMAVMAFVDDCHSSYWKIMQCVLEEHVPHLKMEIVIPDLDEVFMALTSEGSE